MMLRSTRAPAPTLDQIDAETLEAGGRRLRAGIINADGAGECGPSKPPP